MKCFLTNVDNECKNEDFHCHVLCSFVHHGCVWRSHHKNNMIGVGHDFNTLVMNITFMWMLYRCVYLWFLTIRISMWKLWIHVQYL
jgi:hypothetical protein